MSAELGSPLASERAEARAACEKQATRERDRCVRALQDQIEAANQKCAKAVASADAVAARARSERAADIVREFHKEAGPLARARRFEPSRAGDQRIVAAFKTADDRCRAELGEPFAGAHHVGLLFCDLAIEKFPSAVTAFAQGDFTMTPMGQDAGAAAALKAGDDLPTLALALNRLESRIWSLAQREASHGREPTQAHRDRYAAIRGAATSRDVTLAEQAIDKAERDRRQAEYEASLREDVIAPSVTSPDPPPVTEGSALARLVERARGAISRAASAP